jgi:hypothetical protein
MAVQVTPVMVTNTSASPLPQIPAGSCAAVIANTSGQTIYLGGSGVTSSTGFPVASGSPPLIIPGYPGSKASTLYAISASSSVTLGFLLSTDD